MEISDRAELHQLWTVDISKGGMFIQTDAPPAMGAALQIRLATPDGSVRLNGRVVHIVDLVSAKAFHQPAGVGVQFVDLSKEVRTRIERYVDGLAERLTGDLAVEPDTEPLEVLFEEARRIAKALTASDLYGAVQVPAGATPEQIQTAISELCHRFAHPPSDCPPPKAARLVQLCRQLERTAALFANPLRRLHYDFHHGLARVKEREAAGEPMDHLRQVWSEVFPEKVGKAREIARRALALEQAGRVQECARFGLEALELDPFNAELRQAVEAWQQGQRADVPADQAPQAPEEDQGSVLNELLEINKKLEELDHFQLIGVSESASPQEISRAYLHKARRYDPERLRGRVPQSVLTMAVETVRRLGIAYRILSDGQRRREYVAEHQPHAAPVADADLARTRNEMGIVFVRKGDYRQAREMFQAAMELKADVLDYQANLAWALIMDPEVDRSEVVARARPLLENAIEKTIVRGTDAQRKSARYHYYLGRLLREQGQIDEAAQHFQEAVRFNPRLAEAATELRLIEMRKRKQKS